VVRPSQRRDQVAYSIRTFGISAAKACKITGLHRSVWYYKTQRDDSAVIEKLQQMAQELPQNGCKKWTTKIRKDGFPWNPKRIHRVYKLLNMNLRRKGKRRIPARVKQPLQVPESLNTTWSIDFVSDQLASGRRFRVFNVIDDHNREAIAISPDYSIPGWKVTGAIREIISYRSKPARIRMDNGPEFRSTEMTEFCKAEGIEIIYIQPGKPMQNGYIERFNGSYRKEVLDAYLFHTLDEVREISLDWMIHYNTIRPHDGLGGKTPMEHVETRNE